MSEKRGLSRAEQIEAAKLARTTKLIEDVPGLGSVRIKKLGVGDVFYLSLQEDDHLGVIRSFIASVVDEDGVPCYRDCPEDIEIIREFPPDAVFAVVKECGVFNGTTESKNSEASQTPTSSSVTA